MSEQRTFHSIFTLQIKGTTRVDFTPQVIHETLTGVAEALQSTYPGTKIEVAEHPQPQGLIMLKPWPRRQPKASTTGSKRVKQDDKPTPNKQDQEPA